jgi:hypothetical protein
MRHSWIALLGVGLLAAGCGPSAHELRERTLSTLNTEANRWDGGKTFDTTAADAYGRPISASVQKTPLNYNLELRSNGPDGLPGNSDDVVVHRSKAHGETTLTDEAAKVTETLSGAAASGMVKGLRKGIGLGAGEEKKKGEEKK